MTEKAFTFKKADKKDIKAGTILKKVTEVGNPFEQTELFIVAKIQNETHKIEEALFNKGSQQELYNIISLTSGVKFFPHDTSIQELKEKLYYNPRYRHYFKVVDKIEFIVN